MRRSVKATTGVFAAALITATCTAAGAPAATHTRTAADNTGPAYFKMTDAPGHLFTVKKTGPKDITHARAPISRTHSMPHVTGQIVKSTEDPGCVTGSAGRQMANRLNADKAAISRDQNNPSAKQADLQRLVTDLQSLQGQMATAEARATHQSVKAGISAMISDLSTFNSGLQAVENGDLSQVSLLASAAQKMQSDGHAVHATCTAMSPRS